MAGYVTLKQQLRNKRSQLREKIFMHKLVYDFKLTAINAGQNLQCYIVEVDDSGYDLIVDWSNDSKKFQIKSRFLPGGARSWDIQAGLLSPTPQLHAARLVPEWNNRELFGINGGIILIDIMWGDFEPVVTYRYTDMYLLMCIAGGYCSGIAASPAEKVLTDIVRCGFNSRAKVRVPISCFIKPNTLNDLFIVAEMPAHYNWSWSQTVHRVFCMKERALPGPPYDASCEMLRTRLRDLTCAGTATRRA
jgi:hypothetical protein